MDAVDDGKGKLSLRKVLCKALVFMVLYAGRVRRELSRHTGGTQRKEDRRGSGALSWTEDSGSRPGSGKRVPIC